jgi:16S rRNA (guanine527-N7)-methyltransferase
MIENVVLDSFCFLEVLPPTTRCVGDLGSGAGIPGIPIAIVRPDLELSLIESRERRASFLSTVVRELGLGHVTVIGARAESLGAEYAGRFDALVMRCAGNPDAILGHAMTFVRSGGVVIVGAGPQARPALDGEAVVVRKSSGTLRTFHLYRKRGNGPGPEHSN